MPRTRPKKKPKTKHSKQCYLMALDKEMLFNILQFVGDDAHRSFALINRKCNTLFNRKSFAYSYAPMKNMLEDVCFGAGDYPEYADVAVGAVVYNRRDLFNMILKSRHDLMIQYLCEEAACAGRKDLLEEIFKELADEEDILDSLKEDADLCTSARDHPNLSEWLREKGF